MICLSTSGAFSQWYNYLDGRIIGVVADGGSVVWAASQGGGLMKVDKATAQITYYNRATSELRNMTILAMKKDAAGNLWIGTQGGGLMKFDGNNSWQTFSPHNSQIPSTDVNAISFDAAGNVWLATDDGLAKFDGTSHYGSWVTYNTDNSQLPLNNVTAVSVATDGSVWAGTATKGVVKINNDTWTLFRRATSSLPCDSITTINANLNTAIWVGCGNGTAVQVKEGSSTWDVLDLKLAEQPSFNPVGRQIFEINKGAGNGILFSTYTGLVEYDGTNKTRYPVTTIATEDDGVFSAYVDNDGTTFAGTRTGLAVKKSGVWAPKPISLSATGMNGTNITSLLVDKTGTVWLGAHSATKFDGTTWKFWGPTTFSYKTVNGIAADTSSTDIHWFAADDGVYKLNGNNIGRVGAIPGLTGKVLCIATDHQGNIWAGTGDGLAKYNGTNWTTYTSATSQIPDGGVSALAVDKNNNIWVGTSFNGAAKFDGTTWTTYPASDHQELGSGPISSIAFASNGDVYFSTVDVGVAKLSGTVFSSIASFNSPLPSDNVTAVAVDKYDALWIATGATGVAKLKGTTWNIYSNENSGLTEDFITSIGISQDQKLWFGTKDGGLVMYNELLVLGVDNGSTNTSNIAMMLSQNTPNPFSGTTMLRLNLPSRSDIRLSIVNAAGQEVALLQSGMMDAGQHVIPFDATGLPSGTYFSRLVSAGRTETRPMVVAH